MVVHVHALVVESHRISWIYCMKKVGLNWKVLFHYFLCNVICIDTFHSCSYVQGPHKGYKFSIKVSPILLITTTEEINAEFSRFHRKKLSIVLKVSQNNFCLFGYLLYHKIISINCIKYCIILYIKHRAEF